MTREKKTLYNIISNIGVQCIAGISGLFIPKLILMRFGSDINGLINSVTQFLNYVSLLELGVGEAAIVILYKPIADGDGDVINRVLSIVKKKYLFSGSVYTVVIIALAFCYPAMIKTEFDYFFIVSIVIVIAMISMIDFFIIGKYKVLLLASQKYYIINTTKMIATTVLTVGSCILLVLGYNILFVKFLAVITHMGEACFIRYYVKCYYPNINYRIIYRKNMIPQQWSTLIHQLMSVIIYNTDMVVLTLFGTGNKLKEVSVYSVYMLAFSAVCNLLLCLGTGMNATYGDMIAKNEVVKLKKYFEYYEYWYLMILYLVYSVFAVMIVPFVSCYTKGVTDVNYMRHSVGILFALCGLLAQVKEPHRYIILAYGHYRQTQKYTIAEACINITISILAIKQYGIAGVLFGTAVSHFITDIGFITYADKYLLTRNYWQSFKNNLFNMAITVAMIIMELKIIRRYEIQEWGMWIVYSIVVFIINIISISMINILVGKENFLFGMNYVMRKIYKEETDI